MMAGGEIEFTSTARQAGSTNDNASFTFAPSFGYFISDNLAVGASLNFNSQRWGTGAGKTVSTSVGIGPFARYYKFTSNESFAIFGQAGLSFASSKTDPPTGFVSRGSSIGFRLSPGVAYFFNEHWALELTFQGFSISSSDPDKDTENDKSTYVALGIESFNPYLGVRFHF